MTNFERIKAMSVEELAGFIEGASNDLAVRLFGSYVTRDKEYIRAWLESEVTYDD